MFECQAAEQLGCLHQILVFYNVSRLDKTGIIGVDFRTADL